MSAASRAASTAARSRLAIRRQLATTPGRLRLAAALLTLAAVAFGVVAAQAVATRADAVRTVTTTEGRLVKAVDLSAHLSAAHATAASSFLLGGPEQAISRRQYVVERRAAARDVAELGDETETSSPGARAVRQITEKLPAYAGLIEAARANYRLGFPVGAAYLRQASAAMHNDPRRPLTLTRPGVGSHAVPSHPAIAGAALRGAIQTAVEQANDGPPGMLPFARELYEIEATSLTAGYEAGVSTSTVLAVILAGCALLALLAASQVYIARVARRIVNLGLASATGVLLVLLGWICVAFALQHGALVAAQREGSDPIELLTVTRILASRAQAHESIGLLARGGGGGEARLGDVDRGFQALVKPIGRLRPGPALGSGGLLHRAAVIAGPANTAIDAIYDDYRRYLTAHEKVVASERVGYYSAAVDLALGQGADVSTKAAADALDSALNAEVRVARRRFARHVALADSWLAGLSLGVPVLTAACALLALSGVRQRLAEYR